MAKHSNPDTQFSNSEVLGTASSLSFPSEPPDIRNWFSSYVYESPEFNTGDDFEGYPFRRSEFVEEGFNCEQKSKEMEENLGVFRKIRNKDELVLGEKIAPIGFVRSNNAAECHNQGNKNASLSLQTLQDGFQAMRMNLQYWIQVMISKVLFLQKVNVTGWGVMLKTAAKKKERI
ncbi:hypothetical protein CsSME_00044638 [Camellia sinensis var. sinensis]